MIGQVRKAQQMFKCIHPEQVKGCVPQDMNMTGDWLYELNLGVILLGTLLLLLLSLIVGYWLGRRARGEGGGEPQVNTIQAAVLGMLGLLLAFTFSMAAARYDTRRSLVLQESNAIGTAYLRTQMLPEPHRAQISELLREYVDVRLEFFDAGVDPVKLQLAIDKTEQIQAELWGEAVAVSTIDPRSVPAGLFIQSLNEAIDLHAARLTAMKNRVPEVIIDLIFIASILTLGLLGYTLGMAQHRSLAPALLALLLIVVIIGVIIDLDRPRRGLITVSQESMIQLQQSIK